MSKRVKNPKLLKAKELFHVKLGKAMDAKGWKAADLARAMPGVQPALVSRWLNGGRIPTGIYMCWLLMVLGIRPEELVDLVPVSESIKSSQDGSQKTRSAVPEGQDARWLLEALEGLVGDFRRYLWGQEKGDPDCPLDQSPGEQEKGDAAARGTSG